MAKIGNNPDYGETKVFKARLDHVTVYEVSEGELAELERGNNADLFLEFAIASFSVGLSFGISLLTTTLGNLIFTVFVCVTILGLVLGLLLGILWYRSRRSKKGIIANIRERAKSMTGDISD